MKVKIPTTLVAYARLRGVDYFTGRSTCGCLINTAVESDKSYFWQTKGNNENRVVHSKKVGETPFFPEQTQHAVKESARISGYTLDVATCYRHVITNKATRGSVNVQVQIFQAFLGGMIYLQVQYSKNISAGGLSYLLLPSNLNGTLVRQECEGSQKVATIDFAYSSAKPEDPRFTYPSDLFSELSQSFGACTSIFYDGKPNMLKIIKEIYSIMELPLTIFRKVFDEIDYWGTAGTHRTKYQTYSTVKLVTLDGGDDDSVPEKAFIFNEDLWVPDPGLGILLGRKSEYYWLNGARQKSFVAACDNLPRMSDNNLQNISEVVSFIRALVIDHKIEIPSKWQSAWLAYRYAYGTGKQDVKEAISFMRRRYNLKDGITTYGSSSFTLDNLNVTCRCTLKMKMRNLSLLNSIWQALSRYGLASSFYILWDSIPYSFIVDWFLPIGDILSAADRMSVYSKEYYDYEAIVYSLSYLNGNYHCYSRWTEAEPPLLNGTYWFDNYGASQKTQTYRAIDAVALITG